MTTARLTRERLAALRAEGLSTAQIAARLGVHPDSVRRAERATGLRERVTRFEPLTPEEEARINALAAEGVPATWIAEDIGRSVHAVMKRLPRGRMAGWRSVWQGILKSPSLHALHQEFAPKQTAKQMRSAA